ncbi:NAD(P)-dependent oxidoreductase [Microbacterium sp. MEC084]|uniref:NAD-dependent epimerase/dehydratase family protein n=1 Tax=Microbacterium sp. MEC084 TaxID=1963027 RepID=UPI0011023DAD|nr:NAD-dependent epimerase/dehydratase family protein [Microbacterium sp. MEC084]
MHDGPPRALVIGSSGFLGTWLVDSLVRRGYHVTGVSRSGAAAAGLESPHRTVTGDVATMDLDALLLSSDHVYFLAGRASVPQSVEDPCGDLDDNVRAVLRVLWRMRVLDARARLVYASSAAVYGTSRHLPMSEQHPLAPLSPYGVSKLSAELYVRLFAETNGLRAASARFFSIYGPGQRKQVVYDLSRRVAAGERPVRLLGDARVSRDFVHVRDAADAMITVAEAGDLRGEAYNIASGVETTLATLAAHILAVAGRSDAVEFSGQVRAGDPENWQADVSALRSLGFSPTYGLEQGLAETYRWVAADAD